MTSRASAKSLRATALSRILRDMTASEISFVSILRAAHPDAPSMREIARGIGVSAASVSLFELGRYELPPQKLEAYAKAIERTVEEVRWRWMRQALAFHAARAAELREQIAQLKRPDGRSSARPRALLKARAKRPIDRRRARG